MSPEKYSYKPNYCNAIKFVKCPNGYYPTSFKELVDRLHGRNGSTTLDRTIEKPLVIVPLHPGTWTSERGQKVIHTINLFMDTLLPTVLDEATNSSTSAVYKTNSTTAKQIWMLYEQNFWCKRVKDCVQFCSCRRASGQRMGEVEDISLR